MARKQNRNLFKFNTQFKVIEKDVIECEYYFKSDHRDKSPLKSQWTIKPDAEKNCFIESHKRKWTEESKSWGINLDNEKLKNLGVNKDGQQLNVAVFVDSFRKNVWHGYPADFKRDRTDLPTTIILAQWRLLGYIKKSRISQAINGKICSL